jgi:hypothetical protein
MTDKIVTPQQVDLENRKNKFVREVDKLGLKYQITVMPKLAYTPEGVIPVLAIQDRVPTLNPLKPPTTNEKA